MAAAKVEIIYEAEATSLKATVNEVNKANSEVVKDAQVSAQKVSDSFKEAGNNIANAFANQKIKTGLDNLNKEIKQTSSIVVKSAQDVSKFEDRLRELSVAGQRNTDEFKDIAKAVGEYKAAIIAADRAVDLYAKSTDAATGRIGELEDKLYDLALAGKSNTREFRDLVKEVATVRRAVIETDAQVDNLAKRGAKLTGFVQSVELVGSAFQAVEGAAALFGAENEELQKTLVRLQAIMAITSALEQGRAIITEQLAAKTGIATVAQSAYNVVVGTSTGLLKGLRIALAATGIGLFVFGLVALVENFDKVKKALENSIPGFKQFSEGVGFVIDKTKELIGISDKQSAPSAIAKYIEAEQRRVDASVKATERRIQLAQAEGKDTSALEAEKEKILLDFAQRKLQAIEKNEAAIRLAGINTKELEIELEDEVADRRANIQALRIQGAKAASEAEKELANAERQAKLQRLNELAQLEKEFRKTLADQAIEDANKSAEKQAEIESRFRKRVLKEIEDTTDDQFTGRIIFLKKLEAEEGSSVNRRIEILQLEAAERQRLIKLSVDDKVKANRLIELDEAQTQAAIRDEQKKSTDKAIDNAIQVAGIIANTLGGIIDLQNQQSNARIEEINAENEAQITAIEKSTETEVNKQRQLDALQLRTNQKIAAEKTKQAEANKALAIFNAIIGTAQSVASAGNPVLAAIQLAAGLAQIAIIRAQPVPKFKKGGPVGGKSHEAGGTLIEAEKGEYVVNKTSVSQHRKALDAMNTSSAAFRKYIDEKYVRPAIAGYSMNSKRDGITVNASLNSKSMERKLDKLNKTMANKNTVVNINGFDSRYSWQQN
jgi:hypothetical protein